MKAFPRISDQGGWLLTKLNETENGGGSADDGSSKENSPSAYDSI